MASTSTATKPIQTILDSTRLATFSKIARFVRRSLIDRPTTKGNGISNQPIQGRPRNSQSKAFKEFTKKESARVQKAVNSISHGKHIFVYQNVRTKQVVYSLTRYLEKNNLLKQMVYHGKKTVPAEIRRDLWIPYYSVHFGDTRLGLRAYQLLREFSLQRQLSPPPEMITVTEEFLAAKRPKDALAAEEFDKQNKKRIGLPMEKKERARVLMDQRATSVADIAAVLAIQEEEIEKGFLDREYKEGKPTRRTRQRRREARAREAAQAQANAARIKSLEDTISREGGMPIKIGEGDGVYPDQPGLVKVLWRDAHDAYYAESWPSSVEHGELVTLRDTIIGPERVLAGSGSGSADVSEGIVTKHEFKERKLEKE